MSLDNQGKLSDARCRSLLR